MYIIMNTLVICHCTNIICSTFSFCMKASLGTFLTADWFQKSFKRVCNNLINLEVPKSRSVTIQCRLLIFSSLGHNIEF